MDFKEALYSSSPIYLQNILCSVYGTLEKRKRFSKEFFTYLNWLEETQYWGEKEIYEYKLRELQKIYQHAYASVPFYRKKFQNAGLTSNSITEIEDFSKVPILEKEEIRNHWKDFVSSNTFVRKLIPRQTGGTSGKALDFYATRKSTSFQWAVWWRFRERFGVKFGDKSLNFIGKPVVPIGQKKPPFWRINKPLNQYLVNMQHMKVENIKSYVAYINKEHFVFFSGYPSILYSFCSLVENMGLTIQSPPRVVFTGAEKLLDYQRSCMERVLQCTVTDQYGFSEGAGNASKCEYDVFHEDFEFGHLETHGRSFDSPLSYSGEILATGFANYGMPFIKYNVGDTATWSTQKCACGRHSAIITEISGRNEDFILTPEGTNMKVHSYLFKDTLEIQECQVVQYELGEMVFRIVKRENYTSLVENHLIKNVRKWISPTIRVRFEYVEEIERTGAGKFKEVISFLDIKDINVTIDPL